MSLPDAQQGPEHPTGSRPILIIIVVAVIIGLAIGLYATIYSPTVVLPSSSPTTRHPTISFPAYTSFGWGGYIVHAPTGAVSNVTGTWVVPTIHCGTDDTHVLFWAGIDGLKPSNTVEQIGTRSDCADGVVDYFAWYELWPLQLSTIKLNNISISAGDAVRASVSGNNSSKTFSMVITDETTRVSTHARGRFANASLSSAEWIVEAPGYTNGTRRTMANFTSVTFSSNFATISDQTKPLIAYPSQGQAYGMEYIDLCSDGGIKLQPSPIDSTDNSFAIKWLAGANC